jgi:hypothetical protein
VAAAARFPRRFFELRWVWSPGLAEKARSEVKEWDFAFDIAQFRARKSCFVGSPRKLSVAARVHFFVVIKRDTVVRATAGLGDPDGLARVPRKMLDDVVDRVLARGLEALDFERAGEVLLVKVLEGRYSGVDRLPQTAKQRPYLRAVGCPEFRSAVALVGLFPQPRYEPLGDVAFQMQKDVSEAQAAGVRLPPEVPCG